MPPGVLAAVLGAAFLHAAWNAAIKSEADKLLASMAVSSGAALALPAPDGRRRVLGALLIAGGVASLRLA